MVLLIVHFFVFVFELLKVSSHSGDECEASALYALLPSPVTALILTRIRKTSNMCFLILTWSDSCQPIFRLSAFSMDKNMSAFQTSWYSWGKTLLNWGDKWIYNAFSVTWSWKCFRIGTLWKKSENQYLHLMFRQKEVQLLWTMYDSPIGLHNLPDELRQECSPGWRVFLLFSHSLSWVSSEDYGYCRSWERCNSTVLFEVMAALTNALMFFQDLKQNKTIVCPDLNQLLLFSTLPDFSVPIIPLCSWFCRSLLGFFIGATSVLFQKKDVEGPHQVM